MRFESEGQVLAQVDWKIESNQGLVISSEEQKQDVGSI